MHVLLYCAACLALGQVEDRPAAQVPPFVIQVVDDQTGRGVPLVELTTTNMIRLWTDSNGLVAFHEPGLMDTRVWFSVRSHGYEHPADGFGSRGVGLQVTPGGQATIKIKRLNIAERLYRQTGQGIYRDTVLAGRKAPTSQPVIDGLVMGCDSVLTTIYQGRLFWIWGDTGKPSYPLGNFHCTGATSRLPADGGLDPAVGVDFDYFTGPDGFVKGMAPVPGDGPTWIDEPVVFKDAAGRERMYVLYAKIRGASMECYQRGLCEWDEAAELFKPIKEFPVKAPLIPAGHYLRHADNGREYLYFCRPLPFTRVAADAESLADLSKYEAYTCLKPGEGEGSTRLDRDEQGRLRYAWKRGTALVSQLDQEKLAKANFGHADEFAIQARDVESGKRVVLHGGSVYWNEYRKRYVAVMIEIYGTSMLGEMWYMEADDLPGPWRYARKIVTHDRYSYYNPKHHPYFDQEGGRLIYFEGTYTNSFSGNADQTPRYDYNQVMYRLDLGDPRMILPAPVYAAKGDASKLSLGRKDAGEFAEPVFYACDRPGPGMVPVGLGELTVHALPADMKNPPESATPLYQARGGQGWTTTAPDQEAKPLCLVWK